MTTSQALDRLLDPVGKTFGVRTAAAIANLRADADLQAKMEYLARRCTDGELTPEEKGEYDALVSANNIIAILQAKARAVLIRRRKKK